MIWKPYDDDDDQGDFDDNRPCEQHSTSTFSSICTTERLSCCCFENQKTNRRTTYTFQKNIYICCSPTSFLDFFKLTLLRQKECRRELLWVFRDWLGPPGCVDLLAALSAPNIWFHHRHIERSDITKDCLFHPGKERLALGSV